MVFLGRRRSREVSTATEDQVRAQLAVDLAQNQLNAQLDAADSDDAKSLGYLAVDVAAAVGVVVLRSLLPEVWVPAAAAYALAAGLLMTALREHRYWTGPDPRVIYFQESGTPRLDVVLGLRRARDQVESVRLGWSRRGLYRVSRGLTILATVGTASSAVALHFHHG